MFFKLGIIIVSLYIGCAIGAPSDKKDVCDCEFKYAPVCGNDGNTYPNQCGYECQKANQPGVEKLHDGECKTDATRVPGFPGCICTKQTKMVCGSNGLTYSNRCSLDCANEYDKSIQFEYMGPCSYGNKS